MASNEMIGVGNECYVSGDKIVAVYPYNTNMAQSLAKSARENGRLHDCTGKKCKASLIVTAIDGAVLYITSFLSAKTIANRLKKGIPAESPRG